MEIGQSYTLFESDLLAGFTDPDGDTIYITNTWTDYGNISFDIASSIAYLPLKNGETLNLNMLWIQYPNIVAGYSFTVPNYFANEDLNSIIRLHGNNNYTTVTQTINVSGPPQIEIEFDPSALGKS